MNDSEKKIIYNLLKAASDNLYGFSSPDFEKTSNAGNKGTNQEIKPDGCSEDKKSLKSKNIGQIHTLLNNIKSEASGTVYSINKPAETEKTSETVKSTEESKTLNSENTEKPVKLSENEKTSGKKINFETLNEKIIMCNNCPENVKGIGKNLITFNSAEKCTLLAVSLKKLSAEEAVLQEKMLSSIQLKNGLNCSITSILKCVPRSLPPYQEFEGCKGFIEAEIHLLKPDFILFLGQLSANIITNQNCSLEDYRGKTSDYNGIPFTATFTPENVLKDPSLKRPVWEDLKFIKSKLTEINPEYGNSQE